MYGLLRPAQIEWHPFVLACCVSIHRKETVWGSSSDGKTYGDDSVWECDCVNVYTYKYIHIYIHKHIYTLINHIYIYIRI